MVSLVTSGTSSTSANEKLQNPDSIALTSKKKSSKPKQLQTVEIERSPETVEIIQCIGSVLDQQQAVRDYRIKRSLENIDLVKKIETALDNGTSLKFLKHTTVDPEVPPVVSKELMQKAFFSVDSTAITFLTKGDPSRLELVPEFLLEKMNKEYTTHGKINADFYSRFIITLIQEGAPKLRSDFFHIYLAKRPGQYNIAVMQHKAVADILKTVAICFKIDGGALVEELNLGQLQIIRIHNMAPLFGLPEDRINRRIIQLTPKPCNLL